MSLCFVLKHPKFALNIALLVRHENFLHPKTGKLQEVSRESVHIYTLQRMVRIDLTTPPVTELIIDGCAYDRAGVVAATPARRPKPAPAVRPEPPG